VLVGHHCLSVGFGVAVYGVVCVVVNCLWCLCFFLLFSSRICVGNSVGLKKLVTGGFLFVWMPVCFVVSAGWVLGWL